MIDYKKPEQNYPYVLPFPSDAKNPRVWDGFWETVLETQVDLSTIRFTTQDYLMLQRRLKSSYARNFLFVANGISLLPYLCQYSGVDVDVLDISTVANEFCRSNPPDKYLLTKCFGEDYQNDTHVRSSFGGLNFISESIFTFNTKKKYDCVFMHNFIELFEDTDAVVVLRKLASVITSNGSLAVNGPLFRDIYTDKISFVQLKELFSIIRESGFYFKDQSSVVSERKKSISFVERFFLQHIFKELEVTPQDSDKSFKSFELSY